MIFCSIDTNFDPISNEGNIRNKFDKIIKNDIYTKQDCYEILYKEYEKLFKQTKHIISISGDRTISSSTIAGLSTNCINRNGDGTFTSDLKIIYIDSKPDLELFDIYAEKFTNKMYRTSVVSNLLCLINDSETDTSKTYTKHPLQLEPSQFIFLGLQDITDSETNFMLENSIEYYELNKLNNKLENILDKIITDCEYSNNIAVVFDLSSLHINIAPCTIRDKDDNSIVDKIIGFNLDQLNLILKKISTLKSKIRLLDITGHYLQDTKDILNRITIETIQQIYGKIFNLQESSLNIFNEESTFLIYKQINTNDHGWCILRGIDLKLRNEILETIEDRIILLTIPLTNNDELEDALEDELADEVDDVLEDVDVMIMATTMAEQNAMCYYSSSDINDGILYPEEKSAMMFELLNSQKNI